MINHSDTSVYYSPDACLQLFLLLWSSKIITLDRQKHVQLQKNDHCTTFTTYDLSWAKKVDKLKGEDWKSWSRKKARIPNTFYTVVVVAAAVVVVVYSATVVAYVTIFVVLSLTLLFCAVDAAANTTVVNLFAVVVVLLLLLLILLLLTMVLFYFVHCQSFWYIRTNWVRFTKVYSSKKSSRFLFQTFLFECLFPRPTIRILQSIYG